MRPDAPDTVTVPMVFRMRALWDAGLSYSAIAAVVSLDWRKRITREQVRHAMRDHTRGTRIRYRTGMSKAAGDPAGVPKP